MAFIKKIPNIITFVRILCAALLLTVKPFSFAFWILYLSAGISDMADGLLARKLHLESDAGAKLDSIADFIFLSAIIVIMIMNVTIPKWLWISAGVIAVVRLAAYAVGYMKYHTYSALHTYMNKITGMMLFVLPVLFTLFDVYKVVALACLIAFVSAVEELLITMISNDLNRDCRSILSIGRC